MKITFLTKHLRPTPPTPKVSTHATHAKILWNYATHIIMFNSRQKFMDPTPKFYGPTLSTPPTLFSRPRKTLWWLVVSWKYTIDRNSIILLLCLFPKILHPPLLRARYATVNCVRCRCSSISFYSIIAHHWPFDKSKKQQVYHEGTVLYVGTCSTKIQRSYLHKMLWTKMWSLQQPFCN